MIFVSRRRWFGLSACVNLGENLYNIGDGNRVGMEPIINEAHERYHSGSHPGTVHKWVSHYIKYGEVPAQTRRLGKFYDVTRPDDPGYNGPQWSDDTADKLQKIVDSHPALYLDEIQDHLMNLTGRKWSLSYIWEKLHSDPINYSLQVTAAAYSSTLS
jgi:hypothetical protein